MDQPPSPALPVRIELAARSADRRIDRTYGLTLAPDLFGVWTLDIAWGRSGAAGSSLRMAFATFSEAHSELRARLARRATARRRIGVPYRIICAKGHLPIWLDGREG